MRCRICGAKLKRDGNICKSCYEKYNKDEELRNDKNAIYKIQRKYLPIYQITRYGDYIGIAIVTILGFIAMGSWGYAIIFLIMFIIAMITLLLVSKRIAINTTCTFYDKKIVWKNKDNVKLITYKDLKEVTYFQDFFQKRNNLGNIQFRPNKGIYLFNGFEMKNVPDFKETWLQINKIIKEKKIYYKN